MSPLPAAPAWRRAASRLALVLGAPMALMLACGPGPERRIQPVVIGGSISLTGSNARTGQEMKHGYDLWVEDVNARGGLLGHPVELRIYDDQSNPATGRRLYERLIQEDRVDLVTSPYGSPVAATACAVALKHGYPMIAAGAAATELWDQCPRFLFGVFSPDERYMDGAIEVARAQGARTVAIIHENTNFATGVAAGAASYAREKGLEVVLHEAYARDAKDFTALIEKVKAAKPAVVIGGTYLPDAVNFTRQAKELRLDAAMIALSVGPALPDFYKDLGSDADFIYGASQWEPSLRLPGVEEFVRKYVAAYGYEPGYHAATGYGAGQILEAAVGLAGSLDVARLRDALQALETTTVFGPYRVDDKGRQLAKPSYLTQWQSGRREIVWPPDTSTAEPVWPAPAWRARR